MISDLMPVFRAKRNRVSDSYRVLYKFQLMRYASWKIQFMSLIPEPQFLRGNDK